MAIHPQRKTHQLLKGRSSIPHARYFITLCTKDRVKGLTEPLTGERIRKAWRRQHREKDYYLHCATIMPDHVHWLCTLGERISLSQTVSKFKALIKIPMHWQRNYYDHRLRGDDAKEPFSKYIFLNPYRKELLPCSEEWIWWTQNRCELPEFITHLVSGKYPPPEWLHQNVSLHELIEQDKTDTENLTT
jgi:hypothetical protein